MAGMSGFLELELEFGSWERMEAVLLPGGLRPDLSQMISRIRFWVGLSAVSFRFWFWVFSMIHWRDGD